MCEFAAHIVLMLFPVRVNDFGAWCRCLEAVELGYLVTRYQEGWDAVKTWQVPTMPMALCPRPNLTSSVDDQMLPCTLRKQADAPFTFNFPTVHVQMVHKVPRCQASGSCDFLSWCCHSRPQGREGCVLC